ncbi:predicted protein [Postia placenta Mad-698-R]|uniref:IPT/TIG domain-containing protein n=1 Tax=Postia placenta MAD-698-R-SB12 TaxID=670580 RepID=A0A1X6NC24_9APHY|nr:hypothetical protein POSPLADRAFT_1043639 [Postia placenta MAD-698-R-SB12]EED78387.1 predicted protein [Postia placenta Mad-698-R]OSX66151.1 hypothetical protein POSPLADRAFT_1043639 [Postia placenta MAD-698-R-SB12]
MAKTASRYFNQEEDSQGGQSRCQAREAQPFSLCVSLATVDITFDHGSMSLQQFADAFLPNSPSTSPSQILNISSGTPSFMLFGQNPPLPMSSLPAPRIHRLIPASGPTFGGIEVTVLGANFHPTMQLNCTFGGTPSTSTQRWSDNTLVLPVWFDGLQKEEEGSLPCLFTYTDETDKALMELALQVVGLKMTGKIEDARNVAMRIVGNTDGDANSGMGTSNAMQLANEVGPTPDFRHLLLSRAGSDGDFERVLIDFLSILDVPLDSAALSVSSSISHSTANGHTLLHLSTMANFPALVKFLIAHGIDLDARDKNGCTALFLAAVARSSECARVLVQAGAALDVVDALGKTPVEIVPSGFFDFTTSVGDVADCDTQEEEEAAWADVDSEDEMEARHTPRRHVDRRSGLRRRRSAHLPSQDDQKRQDDTVARPLESKKALEAGMPDEKQVASFMEMLSRTLMQWQHPQDMIANMQNLPLPHLPNLPGAWNALPQMPAVFPVLVPIPALSALWGDKRGEGRGQHGEAKGANGQPWRAIPTSQDWRAFVEKWTTQATLSARQAEDMSDAPPAYTPRSADVAEPIPSSSKEKEVLAACSAVASRSVVDRHVSRAVGYQTVPLPEEEMQAFAYRPHKPSRKQKKQSGLSKLEAMRPLSDHDAKNLDKDFTKWLDCWRNTLTTIAPFAFDLANHPDDRLATHCMYIEVERSPSALILEQSFKMLGGTIFTRDEVVERFHELDATEEQIEDWKNDNRGDHTVHIIIQFYDLMRFLWFSLIDLSEYKEDKKTSAMLAAGSMLVTASRTSFLANLA